MGQRDQSRKDRSCAMTSPGGGLLGFRTHEIGSVIGAAGSGPACNAGLQTQRSGLERRHATIPNWIPAV